MTRSLVQAGLLVLILLGGTILPAGAGTCCCADDSTDAVAACAEAGACCSGGGDHREYPAEDVPEPGPDDCTCPQPCCSLAGSLTAMRTAPVLLVIRPRVWRAAMDVPTVSARDEQLDLLRPPKS